jgi:hypothetical protein
MLLPPLLLLLLSGWYRSVCIASRPIKLHSETCQNMNLDSPYGACFASKWLCGSSPVIQETATAGESRPSAKHVLDHGRLRVGHIDTHTFQRVKKSRKQGWKAAARVVEQGHSTGVSCLCAPCC